jgi:hypothetical protein
MVVGRRLKQDADFRATPTPSPRGYDRLIDQVVQVSRLREVRALVGFTRLAAPERDDLQPVRRIPLTRGVTEWVPAVEQRGEGIFLQLREDAVARWAEAVSGDDDAAAAACDSMTVSRGCELTSSASQQREVCPLATTVSGGSSV